jgi:ABC-type transport system substrate-binding protein
VIKQIILAMGVLLIVGCSDAPLNNPYSNESQQAEETLYSSFSARPKHLDPARAYSSNEYAIIGQIYEPPLQYHYLKRPYQLEPLLVEGLPTVRLLDKEGKQLPSTAAEKEVVFSEYEITLKADIAFQPHPAFAQNGRGKLLYHQLNTEQLEPISKLSDFEMRGSRELTATDLVYQIKRLVSPLTHSPISELMKQHIVGLEDFEKVAQQRHEKWLKRGSKGYFDLREGDIEGVTVVDRYRYRIRLNGKYPQFLYWLAMPFFAPMAWEVDAFYAQQGLVDKNITLDWYPVGTGPYMLAENNPNRRMILERNPLFHQDFYPSEGERGDREKGLLDDAGQKLPFIDRVVYILEKESIPYWSKFLQGYYDASGVSSDSFDQAVQFSGEGEAELTEVMKEKAIHLQTAVTSSIYYMGFNMLDPVVGGASERARKLRQAIAIAVDFEEYISIFLNGRGIASQGVLPPAIFGYESGEQGINRYLYDWKNGQPKRKSLAVAQQLLSEAGYPKGRNAKTGEPLVLYFDTTSSGPDDKSRLNWYRKQFAKLGIQLVIRSTDYNRFQGKMRNGNAQLFMWGWNADYPDPENFFFLLYGPNGKVASGGENAANYQNDQFDRLFESMRNGENGPQRLAQIQQLEEIIRYDSPWLFGFHPKAFSLYHDWYKNLKTNLMANNRLKYQRIDLTQREKRRNEWNRPIYWPLVVIGGGLLLLLIPIYRTFRKRERETAL